MKCRPYEQGTLDCLCGIYSIVNAMRIIRRLSDDEAQDLFYQLISYVNENKKLSETLTLGINIQTMGSILRDVVGGELERSIPFHKHTEVRIEDFWSEMMRFLKEGRREGARRAILLSLDGAHEHWTIARSITPKQIRLLDSDGLSHLNRRACTTKRPTATRPHRICPTQTYFLG